MGRLLVLPADEQLFASTTSSSSSRKRAREAADGSRTAQQHPVTPLDDVSDSTSISSCEAPVPIQKSASTSTGSGASDRSSMVAFSHSFSANAETAAERRRRIIAGVGFGPPHILTDEYCDESRIEELNAQQHFELWLAKEQKPIKRTQTSTQCVAFS